MDATRARTQPRIDVALLIAATAAVTLFVVIGTLLPFTFNRPMAGAREWFGLTRISWPRSPASDIAVNILVYLPVGALVAMLVARFSRSRSVGFVVAVMVGSGMSVALEWAQTMMTVRVESWIDVCMNTLGASTGACSVFLLPLSMGLRQRALRSWRTQPYATAAAASTVSLVLYHLLPFDFVTTSGELRNSLATASLWPLLGWSGVAITPDQWVRWAGYAAQFAFLVFLSVRADQERGLSRREVARRSLAFLVIVPFTIEVAQIFVCSHAFDLADWGVAALGGCVGLMVAMSRFNRNGADDVVRLLKAVLVVQMAYLIANSLAPFDFTWDHIDPARMLRWPFAAVLARPSAPALADMLEIFTSFAVMAVVARFILRQPHGRMHRILSITILVVGVAVLCEFLQLMTVSRTPDLTPPLIAACAAIPIAAWQPRSLTEF